MTSELWALVAHLQEPEKSSVTAAFTADPELVDGVAAIVAGLPRDVAEQLMRRLGVRLRVVPFGGGALIAAVTDVVYERQRRDTA